MLSKKKISTYLITLLIVLLLIIGGFVLHKKRLAQVKKVSVESIAPWALHVASVSASAVNTGFPALAKISSSEQITIMAQISGTVVATGPREGVLVHKGELLAKLDTSELDNKIRALQAQLLSARAQSKRAADELTREKRLLENGGTSASAVEARRTAAVSTSQQVKALEHEISSLKVRMGYGTITAPAAGVIARRIVEVGDVALPGHPLYTMTTTSGALVRVELPQAILQQVHPGTTMILDYGTKQLPVTVSRVFPTVDVRALGHVEADLSALPFDLPSGSRVACRIILQQVKDALQVPYTSLLCGADGQQCTLFKVSDQDKQSILRKVAVQIRLRGHNGVAVSTNPQGELRTGDKVVVAHRSVLLQLKDGDPVTIATGDMR